jgi:hypothetical protein
MLVFMGLIMYFWVLKNDFLKIQLIAKQINKNLFWAEPVNSEK